MSRDIRRILFVPLVLLTLALLSYSVYQGWTRTESDFPSYYTAALMVRKREPLSRFYDMSKFQQQMDLAGLQNQLGGYIPQTPLTMLPFVPLTGFSAQSAKRLWILLNVALLGATVWLLWLRTSLDLFSVLGLSTVAFGAFYTNLLLGQYYIFLLFLLTAGWFLLETKRSELGGFLFGLVLGLKLLTAPFALYLAAKRQWRALLGMFAGVAVFGGAAVLLFSWNDLSFYLLNILPRSLAGETLDPYNPANGTFLTMLRRILLAEPELNPSPALVAPWVFYFLRILIPFSVLLFSLLTFSNRQQNRTDFAGFFLAALLISPNTASYTFVLLLLPITFLFERASGRQRGVLLAFYFLLAAPMRPSWSWLFPKVWLLSALLLTVGVWHGQALPRRPLVAGLSAAFLVSVLLASINTAAYHQGVDQKWERVVVQPKAIFSSSPASLRDGIVFQSIHGNGYGLRWLHGTQLDCLPLAGDAFELVTLPGRELVRFVLINHGTSQPMVFDPSDKALRRAGDNESASANDPRLSPDRKWSVSTETRAGRSQIFLRAAGTHEARAVTGGACNSFAPAWEWDSSAVLFASDCGRGVGLPALYRARLALIQSGEHK